MKQLKALFIPLFTVYYNAFESGDKTEEYRPYGPRWNERTCAIGREVVLSCGYGKKRRMRGIVVAFRRSIEPTRTQAWKDCYGDRTVDAACIKIRVLTLEIQPEALLDLPGVGFVVVTERLGNSGTRDCCRPEFRAFQLRVPSTLTVGTVVKTLWGACEIVAAPARCRIVRKNWDGTKNYGEPGTTSGIFHTLAAAKAFNQDLSKLNVEQIA